MASLMKSKEGWFSGGKLRYWVGGSGPGLLLCHPGFGDAELAWSRVWDDLAASFTVLAPDLPGFGASSAPRRPSPDSMVLALKEAADACKLQDLLVVGNSFSAHLALEFAQKYPTQVSRVAVINGTPLPSMPLPLRLLLGLPGFKQGFTWLGKRRLFNQAALSRGFQRPESLPEGFFDKALARANDHARMVTEVWLADGRRLDPPRQPLGLIWGAEDRLTPLAKGQDLHLWAHGSVLYAIPDCGHMPQLEQPAQFVEALDHFAGVEFHSKAA